MRKLTFGMNLTLDGYIAAPVTTSAGAFRATSCSSVGPTRWPRLAWRYTGEGAGGR